MLPDTGSQVAALIQMTLVPVIMISAVGLICLVVQNRHAVVVDRIYRLNRERLHLRDDLDGCSGGARCERTGQRLVELSRMARLWLARGRYTRNALASAFLGILLFGLTSLWIIVGTLFSAPSAWHALTIAFFVAGMVAFLASFAFVLVDLQRSLTLSRLDTEFVDQQVSGAADGHRPSPAERERGRR